MVWARNERAAATAGLKTTSYADNVIALRAAKEDGADEAMLHGHPGRVCEGTGTNVFVVLNGHLMTPSLATGCLAGITRELVLEVGRRDGGRCTARDAVRRPTRRSLTSSTRDVQPVSHLDGWALPACPGPRTVQAMEAFAAMVEATMDPDPGCYAFPARVSTAASRRATSSSVT